MIRTIDLGMFQLVSGREGTFLVNPQDRFVGQSLLRYGEFSYSETLLFEQLCEPGDTVIEVGANIGAHTVGLAKRVGPNGRVVALEPQRIIFQNLCANIALNGLLNVDCRQIAAADRSRKLFAPRSNYMMPGNFGGVALSTDENAGDPVDAEPIDQFYHYDRLNLVKIDAEGMEGSVLAGAVETIARFQPILYVENDRRDRSKALVTQIFEMGYRCWWHLPLMFNPDNSFANPENVYPRMVSINLLCIPRTRTMTVNMPELTDADSWPLGDSLTVTNPAA